MSGAERFLVTGALGCIGAWTVHALRRGEHTGRGVRHDHGRAAAA